MKIPAFSLPASDGKIYHDKDFLNQKIVLYLYPKDMTSGCTIESNDFQRHLEDFEKMGWAVLGLSRDSLKSHDKFCTKEGLTFPLLSDENSELISALGAWKEKSMYGKKYMGTERSTFLVVNGEVVQEWRNVKVPGHVAEVLEVVKSI